MNISTARKSPRLFRKWLAFFKAFLLEVDWSADDWRQQAEATWFWRHTYVMSPQARKAMLDALGMLEEANRQRLRQDRFSVLFSHRNKIEFPTTLYDKLKQELEDYGNGRFWQWSQPTISRKESIEEDRVWLRHMTRISFSQKKIINPFIPPIGGS